MLTRRSILGATLVVGILAASPAVAENARAFDAKAFAVAQKGGPRPVVPDLQGAGADPERSKG